MLDSTTLAFLAPCFVASLILTGIHAYLGVHVVERGVIFVDLSLAQIAALGATIALLLPISGGDPHGPVVYWISLAFTFIGAAVFSTIRGQRARIPQEAIIGICYAVASAAAILAMSKATSESEHLKDMLVGNILAVSWPEVGKTAGLYGAVGLFHYIFRKQFLAISMDPQRAERRGEQDGQDHDCRDFPTQRPTGERRSRHGRTCMFDDVRTIARHAVPPFAGSIDVRVDTRPNANVRGVITVVHRRGERSYLAGGAESVATPLAAKSDAIARRGAGPTDYGGPERFPRRMSSRHSRRVCPVCCTQTSTCCWMPAG